VVLVKLRELIDGEDVLVIARVSVVWALGMGGVLATAVVAGFAARLFALAMG
jgi:hypothetical protein